MKSPIFTICGLYFEITEKQTKEDEYLFKSSHLLLDSIHKSPLYYKAKRNKKVFIFHTNQEKKIKGLFILFRNKQNKD